MKPEELKAMNECLAARIAASAVKKKKEIPSSKMRKVKVENKHARYPTPELAEYMNDHMYKEKK